MDYFFNENKCIMLEKMSACFGLDSFKIYKKCIWIFKNKICPDKNMDFFHEYCSSNKVKQIQNSS